MKIMRPVEFLNSPKVLVQKKKAAEFLNNKVLDRKTKKEHAVFIGIGQMVNVLFDADAGSEDELDQHTPTPSAPVASPSPARGYRSKKLQLRYSCPRIDPLQRRASQSSQSTGSDESFRNDIKPIVEAVSETSDSPVRSDDDDTATNDRRELDLDWLEDACALAPSSRSGTAEDALTILRKSESAHKETRRLIESRESVLH